MTLETCLEDARRYINYCLDDHRIEVDRLNVYPDLSDALNLIDFVLDAVSTTIKCPDCGEDQALTFRRSGEMTYEIRQNDVKTPEGKTQFGILPYEFVHDYTYSQFECGSCGHCWPVDLDKYEFEEM